MPVHKRTKTGSGKKTGQTNNATTTTIAGQKEKPEMNILSRMIHYIIVPLTLMLLTPHSVMLIWFSCRYCHGSYLQTGYYLLNNNTDVITGVINVWRHSNIVTSFSVSVVLGFAAWSAVTMILIPGKKFNGPITPKGNIPVYNDNGFYCFLASMAALAVTSYYYNVTIIYDRFDEIIGTLCVFSLLFCLILYFKGCFCLSSNDSGSSGYFIFDYYWGMELYPRLSGIDVKTFTNCRFGLTAWASLVVIFTIKSYELHGFMDSMFVSSGLQLAYLAKFFWWERGYMSTIDIMLDRAGYYICWGCLVFVPGFYTSVSQYLVSHPIQLGNSLSVAILFAGLWSLTFNYMADWQKQKVRDADGKCTIWGQKARFIRAQYQLENGEKKSSILLLSGFWGIARHFHYLPEITLSVCWALPCLFDNLFPYTYAIYLCILLGHRSLRDDEKCSKKYGMYWEMYKKEVPYRIIPGIF